jgi:hypothetical protein
MPESIVMKLDMKTLSYEALLAAYLTSIQQDTSQVLSSIFDKYFPSEGGRKRR